MKELKLHAGGSKDHLEVLKAQLRKKVHEINDSSATPDERAARIKAAKLDFEREKQSLLRNLY